MKRKIELLILLITLTFSINAQDWDLFNDTDKYNYLDLNDSIVHTIWVDSTAQFPNLAMIFNKTIEYKKAFSEVRGDTILIGKLKPNVLFNQICTKVDDSLFFFGINKDWLIKPKNKINDSWVFSNGITATITNCYQDIVFELVDSIKTLELSDGQIVKISKSFGIIYWKMSDSFEIKLIGIDSKLGISIPKFDDYYNYNVGDVFQYNIGNYIESDHVPRHYAVKYTIQSKNLRGDTVSYVLQGMEKLTVIDPINQISSTEYKQFTKVSELINSNELFVNKYSGEVVSLENTTFSYYPVLIFSSLNLNDIYYTLDTKLTGAGKVIKSFSTSYNDSYFKLLKLTNNDSDTLVFKSIIDIDNPPFLELEFELEPLIGAKSYDDRQGMSNQGLYFIGAIIDGDTIGEIYNDEYFTLSTISTTVPNISLFPNPFQDIINLKLEAVSNIVVFDLKGVVRYKSVYPIGDGHINLNFLEPGPYMISIRNEDSIYQIMIIKY